MPTRARPEGRSAQANGIGPLLAVAALAEVVGKRRARRAPAEVGPGLGRVGGLVEQQDLGEVVAQACPRLIIGTGDRSRSADRDRPSDLAWYIAVSASRRISVGVR